MADRKRQLEIDRNIKAIETWDEHRVQEWMHFSGLAKFVDVFKGRSTQGQTFSPSHY
jgi:hypothetical protein